MNHDYEHCIDFKDDCPESCHRAQLVRDLEDNYPEMEVSWMNFSDCPDCERNRLAKNSPKLENENGDTISRQAAKDALNHELRCGAVINQCGLEVAYEVIEDLPPAEPKRGKWIEDKGQQTLMQNFIERGEVWRVCSVCGAGHMIGHKYECDKAYHETHHNFCPNCGADMRGEQDE